jgi:hypothetical protein
VRYVLALAQLLGVVGEVPGLQVLDAEPSAGKLLQLQLLLRLRPSAAQGRSDP